MASAFKFLGGTNELDIISIFHECAEHFVENEDADLFMTPFNYQYNWYNIRIKNITINPIPNLGIIVYSLQMEYQNHSRLTMRVKVL